MIRNDQEIGGRDTDISQIGYSLENFLKNEYPINKVPKQLVNMLTALTRLLEEAEEAIQEFIEALNDDLEKGRR